MGLLDDARNIQRKDPAARTVLEVILLYPGFHILVNHRIAHWLYQRGHFFLARWVSQRGRHKTGIEIHPGATIGKIGAGSVVLKNLPANCTAVGVPAEVVRINNKAVNPADDLDQQDLPDIVAQRITALDQRVSQLEKSAQGDTPPTHDQVAARASSLLQPGTDQED